ncbi:lysine--tRNA ligase [archaeon]|nr:lysine--tRNA ligase [archaeon]|tara:strand:+ start:2712 stop:4181 length:1470 start_codon:yes stop_codon:yes gene_type:complete
MQPENQLIQQRIDKLKLLREKKINPYAYRYDTKNSTNEILEKFKKLKKEQKTSSKVKIAGRITNIRKMGKTIFGHVQDFTGKIQIYSKEDTLKKEQYNLFKKLDLGDIIGIEGTIFSTKTGEITIQVKKFELLTKSLKPLPEKYHGLQDQELRLRKRYLDLISNPENKEIFIKKNIFWKTMRNFLEEQKFIEVETPILENTTGGADAEPFVTHYNALDVDAYLRISCGELWQKRLMVGGFEKTFEIGRQFRNEGVSMEHLQDYTQMEFYWAYADYDDCMKLVEKMFKLVAKNVLGTLKFESHGFKMDLNKKWPRIEYVKEIKKQTGVDVLKASKEQIQKKLSKLKVRYEKNLEKGRLMDLLWKTCRKKLAGPAFIINQPVEVSPLAKRHRKNPELTERFFVLMAGSEMANGYTELNDPIDQENRFKEQTKMRGQGDTEAQMYDKDFVDALMYGMPPTTGFGVSERFFAYLLDKPIRECVLFPFMKPEED